MIVSINMTFSKKSAMAKMRKMWLLSQDVIFLASLVDLIKNDSNARSDTNNYLLLLFY